MNSVIASLSQMLRSNKDEQKAVQMSQYMKGKFSFYGITAPVRNEIQKDWFPLVKSSDVDFWKLIHALWNKEEREYQMVAVDLVKKRSVKVMELNDIDQLEFTIVEKSWWDTVDLIASNYLGKYFRKFPQQIAPTTKKWLESGNIWLQRSCLLFQLKYKEQTDFEQLTQYIKKLKHIDDFFIQKAIGWSLRQYSKFSAEEVSVFIDQENIQGLARKEASKYLK